MPLSFGLMRSFLGLAECSRFHRLLLGPRSTQRALIIHSCSETEARKNPDPEDQESPGKHYRQHRIPGHNHSPCTLSVFPLPVVILVGLASASEK
jgi:hypothetical protein